MAKLPHQMPAVVAITAIGLAGAVATALAATPSARSVSRRNIPNSDVMAATNAALLDQINCQKPPQVALAINAMLANRVIRYFSNENGVYYFTPTAPMTFLGMRVTHISGFSYDEFKGVPDSRIFAPTSPEFLEIDVAAPEAELRKKARNAGLIEGTPSTPGFYTSKYGSYTPAGSSNIACSATSSSP